MQPHTTRLLLTCAAIGAAGGIVFILDGLVSGTIAAAVPFLYGATLGAYFLPGALASILLRRPGVALLSSVIAGLIVSPFTPIGLRAVGATALIGALQELPFAVTLYRRRPVQLVYLGAVIAGIVLGSVVLIALDVASQGPVIAVLAVVVSIVSPLIVTGIAHLIANGVARTGVTRGIDQRPRR